MGSKLAVLVLDAILHRDAILGGPSKYTRRIWIVVVVINACRLGNRPAGYRGSGRIAVVIVVVRRSCAARTVQRRKLRVSAERKSLADRLTQVDSQSELQSDVGLKACQTGT